MQFNASLMHYDSHSPHHNSTSLLNLTNLFQPSQHKPSIPVKYPTKHITAPMYLFIGSEDPVSDVEHLKNHLPDHTVYFEVGHYSHLDFMWAEDLRDMVWGHVLKILDGCVMKSRSKVDSHGAEDVEVSSAPGMNKGNQFVGALSPVREEVDGVPASVLRNIDGGGMKNEEQGNFSHDGRDGEWEEKAVGLGKGMLLDELKGLKGLKVSDATLVDDDEAEEAFVDDSQPSMYDGEDRLKVGSCDNDLTVDETESTSYNPSLNAYLAYQTSKPGDSHIRSPIQKRDTTPDDPNLFSDSQFSESYDCNNEEIKLNPSELAQLEHALMHGLDLSRFGYSSDGEGESSSSGSGSGTDEGDEENERGSKGERMWRSKGKETNMRVRGDSGNFTKRGENAERTQSLDTDAPLQYRDDPLKFGTRRLNTSSSSLYAELGGFEGYHGNAGEEGEYEEERVDRRNSFSSSSFDNPRDFLRMIGREEVLSVKRALERSVGLGSGVGDVNAHGDGGKVGIQQRNRRDFGWNVGGSWAGENLEIDEDDAEEE
jgi:hypothetical protein